MRVHVGYLISLMGWHKNGGKNNTSLLLACRSSLFEYAHNLYTTSFSKFLTAVFVHMGTPLPPPPPPQHTIIPSPPPIAIELHGHKQIFFFVNTCSFDCPLPSRYITHLLLSIPSRHRRRAKISPLCSPDAETTSNRWQMSSYQFIFISALCGLRQSNVGTWGNPVV